MSNYYLGNSVADTLGSNSRYFYGLRRNSNGSLFFARNDQLTDQDAIEINFPGDPLENYNDFEANVDFFEGLNVNHEVMFENLKYPQYRWDNKSVLYFIDEEGQLVARTNRGYEYPTGLSED